MSGSGRGPGQLRIVAGELKGRRIRVPRTTSVRPTADRVREALFSILGSSVVGARVLDAYSGSGALGFEALSRGARSVVFLEADASILLALRENAEALVVTDRCTFRHGRVGELLCSAGDGQPFDLILADPPYGSGESDIFLPLAVGCLAPGGLLVLERDRADPRGEPRSDVLLHYRTAAYGRNCLDFYRHGPGLGAGRG